MKRLNFIENILLLIVFLLPVVFSNISPQVESLLSSYIERKCSRRHDFIATEKTKSALNLLTGNLDRAFNDVPDYMDRFCKIERTYLINKMRELAKELSHCVTHDEAYLPQFAGQSFVGFLHFMCHNHSEHMQVLYKWNTNQPLQCWHKLLSYPVSNNVENCFYDVIAPMHSVSRSQMCSNLNQAKMCIASLLDRECPHYPVVARLNDRLFKDLMDPCMDLRHQHHKFSLVRYSSGASSLMNSTFALLLSILAMLIIKE